MQVFSNITVLNILFNEQYITFLSEGDIFNYKKMVIISVINQQKNIVIIYWITNIFYIFYKFR